MSRAGLRTDEELLTVDVPEVIATAMSTADPARQLLIGAAVPAALQAALIGTQPRSMTYLAEIVRRGGLRFAAQLAEPLPTTEQTELVRSWLAVDGDAHVFAGWLDAVAAILEARLSRP
ncbi:hypothetical protein [Actinoplanes friuliensis]|jgi:hypothetical protein|uniref:Uncharacterized protein n=1 Tax=Actinoplanes friuliensis DSM 7358 TaxID=1246995 RepID=U5W9S6_9ACTN|nr:hypothetical protein [Actinoplanes friuliensis]AGZ45958.1 hypothetical protein AFR_38520 [Actinoplanes friuliensis DSM 7358]